MSSHVREVLDQLFPLSFSIDRDMNLSRVTDGLRSLCPLISDGSGLLEVLDCHRPTGLISFDDLEKSTESMFLLISKDRNLALKGQMLRVGNEPGLHFVGMPWLAWMNENAPETKLQLRDFPRLDSQMDQEFYVTSQQLMVNDLEALNQRLQLAEDEAKAAIRVQSDFFAVMSHEMRTPLNGVISALSLLGDEKDPMGRKKLARIASESAISLLSVINYTLDYSKIDAGKMPIEIQEFRPITLVESVVSLLQGSADEKSLHIGYTVDPGVPDMVQGDEDKLRQILINIVGNAIKFTERGSVAIQVSRAATDSEQLVFQIADTGVGISSEDLPDIFEPFWGRSKGSTEISTGLGLNIVQQLVNLLSGQVNVNSVLGEGTTFELTLLLPEAESEDIPNESSGNLALPQVFSGRILLVDDNQTNLMLGRMILEKHGVSVRTASNGQEALDIVSDLDFDLVLMDIAMPVMDGVTATKAINLLASPPPVVALTAKVSDEIIAECLAGGFRGYLKKPMEPDALLTELNIWLKPRELKGEDDKKSGEIVSKVDVLDELARQVGKENFERVRQLFLEESRTRITSLLSAWVRRDLEGLRKEAHTLASSVASFGCEDLSWRLKQIEKSSSEDDVTEIIGYMKDIEAAGDEALAAVRNYSL